MVNETRREAEARFIPRSDDAGAIRIECPPDYTYVLQWEGALLPITNMFDVYGDPTSAPESTHTVVAYMGPEKWLSTTVYPEEIFPRR